jgi:hypothetical protein
VLADELLGPFGVVLLDGVDDPLVLCDRRLRAPGVGQDRGSEESRDA